MIMIINIALLLPFAFGHSQQMVPKPRNIIHCGDKGSWNTCQNHRVWGSNGYNGSEIGKYPVEGGHPCVGKGPNGEANAGQFAAMSKAGDIQEKYKSGQEIDVTWECLADHGGIYSWRLCPDADNPSEDCFKEHQLEFVGGGGQGPGGKWKGVPGGEKFTQTDKVKLPDGFSCDKCIISWRLDGEKEKSTFINCADVTIVGKATTGSTSTAVATPNTFSPNTSAPDAPGPNVSPSGGFNQNAVTEGCCKFGGDCGDCGEHGTGWCHKSESNCVICNGIFDASAQKPSCSGIPVIPETKPSVGGNENPSSSGGNVPAGPSAPAEGPAPSESEGETLSETEPQAPSDGEEGDPSSEGEPEAPSEGEPPGQPASIGEPPSEGEPPAEGETEAESEGESESVGEHESEEEAESEGEAERRCCYTSGCTSCTKEGSWCSQTKEHCESECKGTYCTDEDDELDYLSL